MKVLIQNKTTKKLVTTKPFTSIEEAKKFVKKSKKYWTNLDKIHPGIGKHYLDTLNKCIFAEIDFEQNFNCGLAYSEMTKGSHEGLEKKANFIKERVIQEKIEQNLGNQSRVKRFSR